MQEIDSECMSALNNFFLDTAVEPQEFSWMNMPEICQSVRQRTGCQAACDYDVLAFRTPQELVRFAVRNPPTFRDIFQDPMSDRELALEAVSNPACRFYPNQHVRPELSEQCNAEPMLRFVLFVEACTYHRSRLFVDRALKEHHPEGLSRHALLLSEIDNQTWSLEQHRGIRNWMREDLYRDAWVTESCHSYPDAKISLWGIVRPLLQNSSIVEGERKSSVNSSMTVEEREGNVTWDSAKSLLQAAVSTFGEERFSMRPPLTVEEREDTIFEIGPYILRSEQARWEAEYVWRHLSLLANPWALSRINIDNAESQVIEYRQENWPLMDALGALYYYKQNDEHDSNRTVRDRLVVKARHLAQDEGIELDWEKVTQFMDLPARARLQHGTNGDSALRQFLIDYRCFGK